MKIFKICGIPIHKIHSDEEFVEKIRKRLRRSKKLVWIHLAALLLICVFMPKLIGFVWQMIEDMPDEAQQWAWIGLMLGFTFGAFIGQYIIIAGQAALMALDLYDFNRGNRLLITYHDMLQEIAAQQQAYEQQDGQEFSEGKKHGQPS